MLQLQTSQCQDPGPQSLVRLQLQLHQARPGSWRCGPGAWTWILALHLQRKKSCGLGISLTTHGCGEPNREENIMAAWKDQFETERLKDVLALLGAGDS